MLEEVLVLGRQHGLDQEWRDVLVSDQRALLFAVLVDEPAIAAVDLKGYRDLDFAQLGRLRHAGGEVVVGPDEEPRHDHGEAQRHGQNCQQNL